jgi:hypothetical protein
MSKKKVLLRVIRYLVLILFPLLLLTYDGVYQIESHQPNYETVFDDEGLKIIHDEFIQDCKRFGKEDQIKNKKLHTMEYNYLHHGYIGLTIHELNVIIIDTTHLYSSEEFLYVVCYHELSHFYLNIKHDNSCDLCIMMPSISVGGAIKIYYNMEQYKKKLFK